MTDTTAATAVHHEITVDVPQARAFALFTERFDDVKPRSHTLLEGLERSVLEPFVGGRLYDLGVDGSTLVWGTVVACDPPGSARSRCGSSPTDRTAHVWSSTTATSTGTGTAGSPSATPSTTTRDGRCTWRGSRRSPRGERSTPGSATRRAAGPGSAP